MTRFWLTLEQGVRFVLGCVEKMQGGEVFVPKIPSMRMTDLAHVMAPDCEIVEIGIRPGEKLHEVLVGEDESRQTVELDDSYVITPAHPWWRDPPVVAGKRAPTEFRYTSDTNTQWLSMDALRELIDEPTHETELPGNGRP
jgi:UDP-N-acetylglucosamine 4,6-dehydratase